jgi:hypothetical protein
VVAKEKYQLPLAVYTPPFQQPAAVSGKLSKKEGGSLEIEVCLSEHTLLLYAVVPGRAGGGKRGS